MTRNRKNDGRAFETLVEKIALQYTAKGLLRVRKVDPPTRVFGGRVIFTENPFLDFIGCWTERGARLVMFETKSTSKPRLPIDVAGGGLTTKQCNAMRHWHNAGAVVFLLWEFTSAANTIKFFTWSQIKSTLDAGDRSLKFEDGFDVPNGQGFIVHDFLPVMRRKFI